MAEQNRYLSQFRLRPLGRGGALSLDDFAAHGASLAAGAMGRTTDAETLRRAETAYGNKVGTAQALGLSETGEQSPGLLTRALGWFDRPVSAVVGGLSGLAGLDDGDGDDTNDGALDRFIAGLGGRHYGSGDFGALQMDDDDGLLEKFAKGAAAFAVDTALDPLTYVSFGGSVLGKKAAAEITQKMMKTHAETLTNKQLKKFVNSSFVGRSTKKLVDEGDDAAREVAEKIATKPHQWPGSQLQWERHLGELEFAGEASAAYLRGGAPELRRWLKTELGDAAGEKVFKELPRDLKGGLRYRVPFQPTKSAGVGGGGEVLEALGLEDLAMSTHRLRNRARASKMGRAVADRLGGEDGAAFGDVIRSLVDDPAGEALSSSTYALYSSFRAAKHDARTVGRGLQERSRESMGRVNRALELIGAGNQEDAVEAMWDYIESGGSGAWEGAAWVDGRVLDGPAKLTAVQRAGMAMAVEMQNYFEAMLGEVRDAGIPVDMLDDYIARIWTEAERELSEKARAAHPSVNRGGGQKGYDPTKRREQFVEMRTRLDDDGNVRVDYVRHLSPREANAEAGRLMFEAHPVDLIAKYGESVARLAVRARFANAVVEQGAVVAGSTASKAFLKPRTLADLARLVDEATGGAEGGFVQELLRDVAARNGVELGALEQELDWAWDDLRSVAADLDELLRERDVLQGEVDRLWEPVEDMAVDVPEGLETPYKTLRDATRKKAESRAERRFREVWERERRRKRRELVRQLHERPEGGPEGGPPSGPGPSGPPPSGPFRVDPDGDVFPPGSGPRLVDPDVADQVQSGIDRTKPVVVIGCGKQKAGHACTVEEMYTSPYAKEKLDTARAMTDDGNIFVLSAKHGFLPLDETIDPYDLRFGDEGAITVEELAAQAQDLGLDGLTVKALAGADYRAQLKWVLGDGFEDLFAGTKGLGEQRQKMARLRDDAVVSAADAELRGDALAEVFRSKMRSADEIVEAGGEAPAPPVRRGDREPMPEDFEDARVRLDELVERAQADDPEAFDDALRAYEAAVVARTGGWAPDPEMFMELEFADAAVEELAEAMEALEAGLLFNQSADGFPFVRTAFVLDDPEVESALRRALEMWLPESQEALDALDGFVDRAAAFRDGLSVDELDEIAEWAEVRTPQFGRMGDDAVDDGGLLDEVVDDVPAVEPARPYVDSAEGEAPGSLLDGWLAEHGDEAAVVAYRGDRWYVPVDWDDLRGGAVGGRVPDGVWSPEVDPEEWNRLLGERVEGHMAGDQGLLEGTVLGFDGDMVSLAWHAAPGGEMPPRPSRGSGHGHVYLGQPNGRVLRVPLSRVWSVQPLNTVDDAWQAANLAGDMGRRDPNRLVSLDDFLGEDVFTDVPVNSSMRSAKVDEKSMGTVRQKVARALDGGLFDLAGMEPEYAEGARRFLTKRGWIERGDGTLIDPGTGGQVSLDDYLGVPAPAAGELPELLDVADLGLRLYRNESSREVQDVAEVALRDAAFKPGTYRHGALDDEVLSFLRHAGMDVRREIDGTYRVLVPEGYPDKWAEKQLSDTGTRLFRAGADEDLRLADAQFEDELAERLKQGDEAADVSDRLVVELVNEHGSVDPEWRDWLGVAYNRGLLEAVQTNPEHASRGPVMDWLVDHLGWHDETVDGRRRVSSEYPGEAGGSAEAAARTMPLRNIADKWDRLYTRRQLGRVGSLPPEEVQEVSDVFRTLIGTTEGVSAPDWMVPYLTAAKKLSGGAFNLRQGHENKWFLSLGREAFGYGKNKRDFISKGDGFDKLRLLLEREVGLPAGVLPPREAAGAVDWITSRPDGVAQLVAGKGALYDAVADYAGPEFKRVARQWLDSKVPSGTSPTISSDRPTSMPGTVAETLWVGGRGWTGGAYARNSGWLRMEPRTAHWFRRELADPKAAARVKAKPIDVELEVGSDGRVAVAFDGKKLSRAQLRFLHSTMLTAGVIVPDWDDVEAVQKHLGKGKFTLRWLDELAENVAEVRDGLNKAAVEKQLAALWLSGQAPSVWGRALMDEPVHEVERLVKEEFELQGWSDAKAPWYDHKAKWAEERYEARKALEPDDDVVSEGPGEFDEAGAAGKDGEEDPFPLAGAGRPAPDVEEVTAALRREGFLPFEAMGKLGFTDPEHLVEISVKPQGSNAMFPFSVKVLKFKDSGWGTPARSLDEAVKAARNWIEQSRVEGTDAFKARTKGSVPKFMKDEKLLPTKDDFKALKAELDAGAPLTSPDAVGTRSSGVGDDLDTQAAKAGKWFGNDGPRPKKGKRAQEEWDAREAREGEYLEMLHQLVPKGWTWEANWFVKRLPNGQNLFVHRMDDWVVSLDSSGLAEHGERFIRTGDAPSYDEVVERAERLASDPQYLEQWKKQHRDQDWARNRGLEPKPKTKAEPHPFPDAYSYTAKNGKIVGPFPSLAAAKAAAKKDKGSIVGTAFHVPQEPTSRALDDFLDTSVDLDADVPDAPGDSLDDFAGDGDVPAPPDRPIGPAGDDGLFPPEVEARAKRDRGPRELNPATIDTVEAMLDQEFGSAAPKLSGKAKRAAGRLAHGEPEKQAHHDALFEFIEQGGTSRNLPELVEGADQNLLNRFANRVQREAEAPVRKANRDIKATVKRRNRVQREVGQVDRKLDAAREFDAQWDQLAGQLVTSREELLAAAERIMSRADGTVPPVEEQLELFDTVMKGVMEWTDALGKAGRKASRGVATEAERVQAQARRQYANQLRARAKSLADQVTTGKATLDEGSKVLAEDLLQIGQTGRGITSTPDMVGVPPELDVAFAPESIRLGIEKFYRVTRPDGDPEFQTWRTNVYRPLFNLWKTYATVGRGPGYHVRNMIGSLWNNWVADVTVDSHETWGRIQLARHKAGKDAHENVVQQIMRDGVDRDAAERAVDPMSVMMERNRLLEQRLGSIHVAEGVTGLDVHYAFEAQAIGMDTKVLEGLHKQVETSGGNLQAFLRGNGARPSLHNVKPEDMAAWQKWTDVAARNRWIKGNATVAQGVEEFVRGAAFVEGVRRYGLYDAGESAAILSRGLHFSYDDLSDFERHIRGVFFPFWVWSKNNVPLQARALFKEPSKIQKLARANETFREMFGDDDEDVVPSWMQERLGWVSEFRYKGSPLVFGVESPVTDLNKWVNPEGFGKELVGSLSPAIKGPAEAVLGIDTFTGAPFNPAGKAAAPWYRALPDFIAPTRTDAEGVVRGNDAMQSIISDFIPPLSVIDRSLGTTPALSDRQGTSLLSLIAPVVASSTLTPGQKAGELRARTAKLDKELEWMKDIPPHLLEQVAALIRDGADPEAVRFALGL